MNSTIFPASKFTNILEFKILLAPIKHDYQMANNPVILNIGIIADVVVIVSFIDIISAT
jgi:hypothetical protein